MPINNVKKVEGFNLWLANIIVKIHPFGFLGAIIEGERGYGKSMYALKVMAQIHYKMNDITETEAWEMALNSMIFTMEDVINLIDNNIKNDIVSPVVCVDDATVHFCSYKYFTNLYEVILLHGMFDTIRTSVTGLLLTCPSRRLLLAALRNYDDYTIQINKDRTTKGINGYSRIARGIKWFTIPDGRKRFRKTFEDHYSCYVPNWIYEKYMVKRKHYLETINNDMQELIAEKLHKKKKVKETAISS